MLELSVTHQDITTTLQFEHSLVALSKWESKHHKPFLGKTPPTTEELLDYFECMVMSPGVDTNLVYALAPEDLDSLTEYMNDPCTASAVPEMKSKHNPETMTSELIYYTMKVMDINWEAQHWHLNRLMMLIQITNYKERPKKDIDKTATATRWAEANERQKAMFKTKG